MVLKLVSPTAIVSHTAVKGSPLNRPHHLTAQANLTEILIIFQISKKSLKTLYIINNTRNITNIVLFLQICSIKVFKFQVKRLSGVGG
jgi:hypothetical protein